MLERERENKTCGIWGEKGAVHAFLTTWEPETAYFKLGVKYICNFAYKWSREQNRMESKSTIFRVSIFLRHSQLSKKSAPKRMAFSKVFRPFVDLPERINRSSVANILMKPKSLAGIYISL